MDITHNTVLARDIDLDRGSGGLTFALAGALRSEVASLRSTPTALLEALWRSAQFDALDTLDLSDNALTDADLSRFLRHFVDAKRRLPTADLSGNQAGPMCAAALAACLTLERGDLAQTDSARVLPTRTVRVFDTLFTLDHFRALLPLTADDTTRVPLLLPVPARVLLLASERLLPDDAPASSDTPYDQLGERVWAGFTRPVLAENDGRRFVTLRMRGSASAAAAAATASFYALAMQHLADAYDIDSFSIVRADDLASLRDALPPATAHLELDAAVLPDADRAAQTLSTFFAALPQLRCICCVTGNDDATTVSISAAGRVTQLTTSSRPYDALHERDLYGFTALMIDAAHARIWLDDPALPLLMHRVNPRVLSYTQLMATLSLQSNVSRLSLAHVPLSAADLAALLAALPSHTTLRNVDLRGTGLVARDIWQMLSLYKHLSFEYDVDAVPRLRGLQLQHSGGKTAVRSENASLSFRAIVAAHAQRRRKDGSGSDDAPHIDGEMSDAQLAAELRSYWEAHGRLPPSVNLTNTQAEAAVLALLAEYIYGAIEVARQPGAPVPPLAVYLSNTPVTLHALAQLPHHRSIHLFPRLPAGLRPHTLNDIVLTEQTIARFIEGGGTDAALFRWTELDKPPSAWPGMFTVPAMYATYFRILARRARPPIRALALVDRPCDTMAMAELAAVAVQHLRDVEYLLLDQLCKWDVDTRIRRSADDAVNDIAVNRALYKAIALAAGALPALLQIDVVPYRNALRPATERYLDQLTRDVLSSYNLHVSYMAQRPAYVGFAGGVVYGRVKRGADAVLTYSDSVHLPFGAREIVQLMGRRGHGQQDLSLAGRARDVDDNVLVALYMTAVAPLSNVDFSGTAVTMAGIKLLADHPEVPSAISTMHFAGVPQLTRLPQMDRRAPLFGGIAPAEPTRAMLERMRLADDRADAIRRLMRVGAPVPAVKRPASGAERPAEEIDSGDALLRFLQRVTIVLRKASFDVPLADAVFVLAGVTYSWDALPDTLRFTPRSADAWDAISPALFASFFRQAGLEHRVHRLVFRRLPVSSSMLMAMHTLPGHLEFVVDDASMLTPVFFAFQAAAQLDGRHTLVLYADAPLDDAVPNDGLCLLRHDGLAIDVADAPASTALRRHLPFLLKRASKRGLLHVRRAPLSLLLDLLASDGAACFSRIAFVAFTECTVEGGVSIGPLTPDAVLRVFPALRNIIVRAADRGEMLERHMQQHFLPFRRRGYHATLRWTNTALERVLVDASGMALTSEQPRARTHLWLLPDGVFRPAFALDGGHYDTWAAVASALDENFSNVRAIDLSAQTQPLAFSLFAEKPDAFADIDTYVLAGVPGPAPDRFWHDMERVLRQRADRKLSTALILSDDQRAMLAREHPTILALAAPHQPPPPGAARADVPTAMRLEDGLAETDLSLLNDDALATWGALRVDLTPVPGEPLPMPALLPVVTRRPPVAAWSDAGVIEAEESFRAFSHAVLEALNAQVLGAYRYAQFSTPRILNANPNDNIAPLHATAPADNVLQAVFNASHAPQQLVNDNGLIVVLAPNEMALLRQDAVLARSGTERMLLLAMQVTLSQHDDVPIDVRRDDAIHLLRPASEWTSDVLLEHMARSRIYSVRHRIHGAEADVIPQPDLPAADLDVFPTPREAEAAAEAQQAAASGAPPVWGASVAEGERALMDFLLNSALSRTMTPFVRWDAPTRSAWVGFYEGGTIHVRAITFVPEGGRPLANIADRVRRLAAKIRTERMEHTLAYVQRPAADGGLVIAVRNPAAKFDEGRRVSFAPGEIRAISLNTLVAEQAEYPYATTAPVSPAVQAPPTTPAATAPAAEISFRDEQSLLERYGYTYEDVLGRGDFGVVVRATHAAHGSVAIKIFHDREELKREMANYAVIQQKPALAPFVTRLLDKRIFPRDHALYEVVGLRGATALFRGDTPTATGSPPAVGMLVLELMDGSLFDNKPLASYRHAKFLLLLKTTPARMAALLAWAQQAQAAFRDAAFYHGDLYNRNVLFRWDEAADTVEYRVTDFGTSRTGMAIAIESEWSGFISRIKTWGERAMPLVTSSKYVYRTLTLSYDADAHRLWIIEPMRENPALISVSVYVHVVLVPPPQWHDVSLDNLVLDVRVGQAALHITSSSPAVQGVYANVSNVAMYAETYSAQGALTLAPSQPAETNTSDNASDASEENSDEGEDEIDQSEALATARAYLLNAGETRPPLVRVVTGASPAVRAGFYDAARRTFEYMTLELPHLNDDNPKTAENRQSSLREYFAKRAATDVAFKALENEKRVLRIVLSKPPFPQGAADHFERAFSFPSRELLIDTALKEEAAKRGQRHPYAAGETLADAGYTFERVLGSGQESIVVGARRDGTLYAVKLFLETLDFAPFRRRSFLDQERELTNFYETESDAYRAIAALDAFAPLRPHVLTYVGGAALPPIAPKAFVGRDVDPRKNLLLVGYIVLGLMDNDLNYNMKVPRDDFDALFAISARHERKLLTFCETLRAIFVRANLVHLDLHLYNFFYSKIGDDTFYFKIGDLATLRYATSAKEIEREWAVLKDEMSRAFDASGVGAIGNLHARGVLTYDAPAETLRIEYANERTAFRLYVYPLTLPGSFASVPDSEFDIAMTMAAKGGGLDVRVSYVDAATGQPTSFERSSDDLLDARLYRFSMPTALAMREAAEQETAARRAMAVYKPAGGKYSTAHFNRQLRLLNAMLADKQYAWDVRLEAGENDGDGTGALRIAARPRDISGAPFIELVDIAGLNAADVQKLLGQPFLSIERVIVLHTESAYRVDVEMRVRKASDDNRKWRIRMHLRVPSASLLAVHAADGAAAAVAEQKAAMTAAVPVAFADETPSIFFHAVEPRTEADMALAGGKAYTLYRTELQSADGRTLQRVFGGDRLFVIDRVLLANNTRVVVEEADLPRANLLVILATELDESDARIPGRTYAFVVFQFYRIPPPAAPGARVDIKQGRRFEVAPGRSVTVSHAEYLYRMAAREDDLMLDFEGVTPAMRREGGMHVFNDAGSINFGVSLGVWQDDDHPAVVLAIPRPPADVTALLDQSLRLLNRPRAAASTEEATQEEPADDEWVAESEDDEGEDAADETATAADAAFIADDNEPSSMVVEESDEEGAISPRNLLALPATPHTAALHADLLLQFSNTFTLADLLYDGRELTFSQLVSGAEFVRFVLRNVSRTSLRIDSIAYRDDPMAVLASARYNRGHITVRVAAEEGAWRVVISVDDTYAAVREFCLIAGAALSTRPLSLAEESESEAASDVDMETDPGSGAEPTSAAAAEPTPLMESDRGLALMIALLPQRQRIEAWMLECTGEACTHRLIALLNTYFPAAGGGDSIAAQMAALVAAGVVDFAAQDTLFLGAAFFAQLMDVVAAHLRDPDNEAEQSKLLGTALVLLAVNEHVAAPGGDEIDIDARNVFFSELAQLFPVSLTYVDLEQLDRAHQLNYVKQVPRMPRVDSTAMVSVRPLRDLSVSPAGAVPHIVTMVLDDATSLG